MNRIFKYIGIGGKIIFLNRFYIWYYEVVFFSVSYFIFDISFVFFRKWINFGNFEIYVKWVDL